MTGVDFIESGDREGNERHNYYVIRTEVGERTKMKLLPLIALCGK